MEQITDMGFGKLLIGYTFAFLFPLGMGEYGFAAMLVGSFVMYLGLSELKKYCPTFLYAFIADIAMIMLSVYLSVVGFDSIFSLGWGLAGHAANTWVKLGVMLVFDILMLVGIADMCRRVELEKMQKNAYINMIPIAVFHLFQLSLPIFGMVNTNEGTGEVINSMMPLLTILALLYMILNIVLIFKCYVFICPEGDEDMKRKPSKFAFMNKLNAKLDEKQEQAKKSTEEYYRQRFEKNKDNKKKHKKK